MASRMAKCPDCQRPVKIMGAVADADLAELARCLPGQHRQAAAPKRVHAPVKNRRK